MTLDCYWAVTLCNFAKLEDNNDSQSISFRRHQASYSVVDIVVNQEEKLRSLAFQQTGSRDP